MPLLSLKLSGRSKKRWRCQQPELFPLQEKEACSCSEFHAQPRGPWSPCLLPPTTNQAEHPFIRAVYQQGQKDWRVQRKNSECGSGKRYRALACLDHQGRLVEPDHCSSSGDLCLISLYLYMYCWSYSIP